MKIALDVDGVLADVIVSWLNYNNSIRPPISKNQVTDWEFWKKFKIDPFDFYSELSSCWKNWKSIPVTEKNLSLTTKNLSNFAQVDIVTAREVSTNEYMRGNLLLNEVKAGDVAKAFFHLAVSKKTTGAVLTVDGGNIAASLR